MKAAAPRKKAKANANLFEELVVDSFAGGGGASMGIEAALRRCVDIAINHDRSAVEMHSINHPHTRHLCEDVWDVDPVEATAGRPVGLAWFSPDCKHFSRAKGGKPVEKRIRGLAWIVVKWAKLVRPRVIILENVREFEEWGPLNEFNMPCQKRKGQTFRRWVSSIRNLGYAVEWRSLNAADYGAPTHRKRLFLIARCDGKPIVWPEPTHGPKRKPYRTAAECIDWSLPCPSIFLTKEEGRKLGVNRPLAEKTMRRIAMGLKRFVLDNPNPFIVHTTHAGHRRPHGIDEPVPTVTAANRGEMAVVTPYLASRYGEAPGQDTRGQTVDKPLNTITPANNTGMLIAPSVVKFRGDSAGHSVNEPLPTITSGEGSIRPAGAAHAMGVMTPLLVEVQNASAEPGARAIDRPAHTITANPKGGGMALASAFLAKHFGGVVGHVPERPIGTITSVDHHSVVAAHLLKNRNHSTGTAADEPLHTIATGGHHGLVYSFLTKYYGRGLGQAVSEPMPTATVKDRMGLVTVNVGGDPYVIVDIGLRMLAPRELARAQGFPDSYVLTGTKKSQVARIGNSVSPVMAEVLVRANCSDLALPVKRRRREVAHA